MMGGLNGKGERAIEELVRNRLGEGEQITFRIPSSSMTPLLKAGDRVVVSGVASEWVRPGEIVVFRRDGAWVAHRLLRKQTRNGKTWLRTKGDRSTCADREWEAELLAGVVSTVQTESGAIELRSRRAHMLARWLAFCSEQQARVYQGWPGPLRSAVLRVIGAVIAGSGGLARGWKRRENRMGSGLSG